MHLVWMIIFLAGINSYRDFDFPMTRSGPVYKTYSKIEVTALRQQEVYGAFDFWIARDFELSDSFILNLRSRSMAEEIIRELNLHEDVVTEQEFRDLVELVREGIEIIMVGNNVVKFSTKFTDPLNAQKINNIIVRQFIREHLDARKNQEGTSADWIDFLRKQAEELEGEMNKADKALWRFKEENSEFIPTLQAGIRDYFEPSAAPVPTLHRQHYENLRKQSELRTELEALEEKIQRLSAALEQTDGEIVASQSIDRKTGEVISVTNVVNPVYQEITLELKRAREWRSDLEVRARITKQTEKTILEKIKQIPARHLEFARLRRAADHLSWSYGRVKKRLDEAESSHRDLKWANEGFQFRIIDPAPLPLRPYSLSE